MKKLGFLLVLFAFLGFATFTSCNQAPKEEATEEVTEMEEEMEEAVDEAEEAVEDHVDGDH